jgi:hypothetical protein
MMWSPQTASPRARPPNRGVRFFVVQGGATVMTLLVVILAGCTGGSPTTGALTGMADACANPRQVTSAHVSVYKLPPGVKSSALTGPTDVMRSFRWSDLLAAQTSVPIGTTYRLVLPLGRYLVTNSTPDVGAHHISISVGHAAHEDLPNYCP